jgi:hypothetical protein
MKVIKTSPNEPDISQPFEKFERLAKGLMAVPKKELDEKLAEYDRAKKQRKRKKKT